ncbi:hypothetical protein O9992_12405 [Vibrio lentus]|nr:hypothetical protein [Vibrio lentus]
MTIWGFLSTADALMLREPDHARAAVQALRHFTSFCAAPGRNQTLIGFAEADSPSDRNSDGCILLQPKTEHTVISFAVG